MQHNDIKNMKGNLIKMDAGLRRSNIYFIEAPQNEIRYNWRKVIIEEVFIEDFPELKKNMHAQNE